MNWSNSKTASFPFGVAFPEYWNDWFTAADTYKKWISKSSKYFMETDTEYK